MVINILQYITLIGTVLVGFVSLVKPLAVQGFTGLRVEGGRGKAEIRAILGGLFIALGLAPFLLAEPAAFKTVGITYLGVAVARLVGVVIDRSHESSNLISLLVEIVSGVVLLL
jgi:hypothetical protein